MNDSFAPISLEQADAYYAVWDKTPTHALDYTLPNLWGWLEYFGLEWAFDGDLCWIRQTRPTPAYWAPLGNWARDDWAEILAAGDKGRTFIRLPKDLLDIWKFQAASLIEDAEDRGQWEYVYSKRELADLPGPKFHKKRTHVNAYIKTYGEPKYIEINADNVSLVLDVQDSWCQWHECEDSPSLRAENDAIQRVLHNWSKFRNLYGGTLEVDGKMIAFSVGEKLDRETLGVHFEKGLNGYKGVYQMINCEFSRRAGKDFKYINRAQDMNEVGLRQAKTTYSPIGFIEKYTATIKN